MRVTSYVVISEHTILYKTPNTDIQINRLPACAVINRSRGTECQHLDLYLRLPPVSNFVP